MHPAIKIGNSFITPSGVIYKILNYKIKKGVKLIELDCVGRTWWQKFVTEVEFTGWINSGRVQVCSI